MRKILLTIICLSVLTIGSTAIADPWRSYGGKYSDIMGQPIVVRDIQVAKEVIVNGKAYYMYKLIVSRPSNDRGNGVAPWGPADTRLYYWATTHGADRFWSIFDDRPTPQFRYKGRPDLIIIYTAKGLAPSRNKYYLRVGALPYPMLFGYDFRKAIHLWRNEYISYIKLLLTKSNFAGLVGGYVGGKVQDSAIDGPLSRWISVYGQEIELEVYAKAPNIVGLTINEANRELRMRTLIPRLNQKVYNPDKRLHGRVKEIVGRYDLVQGNRIRANTQVAYNVYTSTLSGDRNPQPVVPGGNMPNIRHGGKEICGDGIDNNGNNQIDEGCYKREIIVDDNECRDDTMGLIIDGRSYGTTPAGHKRHFDVSGLAPGPHTLEIVGVHNGGKAMGCNPEDKITYSIRLGTGGKLITGYVKTGEHKRYKINIQ